ncbi:MAG: hypothetical protein ACO388_00550 [Saprospiraceae bacterium]|jgi:hypothetical protein
MKKVFFREVVWFFTVLLFSVPLSFVFLFFLRLTSSGPTLNEVEKVFTLQLFLIGIIVMFVCVYVVRLIVIGIKYLVVGKQDTKQP